VSTSPHTTASTPTDAGRLSRIAVGVDGYAEGRDAAVLGATLAQATAAELMLVAVHPDPLVPMPAEMGWKALHKQAEALLRETRDAIAPHARIHVETDWSIPRALERVVAREHRDLLVVGSSRRGPEGRVRIGTRTRQLLCHCRCALAVAPRGLSEGPAPRLRRVGVGYDGGPEARAALSLAASIALAAGAKLLVRCVVDDTLPLVGWSTAQELAQAMWDEVLAPELQSRRVETQDAVKATGAEAEIEVLPGGPAKMLMELSEQVDLLVIGSRRWGAVARVLLGSTGEALMHDAACPIIVAPRLVS
jgi:nucleotide-binding universal stress UspA family protein